MAEQRVIRHSAFKRRLKSIYIIQPFSRKTSFGEEVLVNIGCGGAVRIDAGVAGEDARETRTRAAFKRDADARLQDAVTAHDASRVRIELRAVEGMSDCRDEFARRIARHLRSQPIHLFSDSFHWRRR